MMLEGVLTFLVMYGLFSYALFSLNESFSSIGYKKIQSWVKHWFSSSFKSGFYGIAYGAITSDQVGSLFLMAQMLQKGVLGFLKGYMLVLGTMVSVSFTLVLFVFNIKAIAFFCVAVTGIAFSFLGKSRYLTLLKAVFSFFLLVFAISFAKSQNVMEDIEIPHWAGASGQFSGYLIAFSLGFFIQLVTNSAFISSIAGCFAISKGLFSIHFLLPWLAGVFIYKAIFSFAFITFFRPRVKAIFMVHCIYHVFSSVLLLLLFTIDEVTDFQIISSIVDPFGLDLFSQSIIVIIVSHCLGAIALTLLRDPVCAFLTKRYPYPVDEEKEEQESEIDLYEEDPLYSLITIVQEQSSVVSMFPEMLKKLKIDRLNLSELEEVHHQFLEFDETVFQETDKIIKTSSRKLWREKALQQKKLQHFISSIELDAYHFLQLVLPMKGFQQAEVYGKLIEALESICMSVGQCIRIPTQENIEIAKRGVSEAYLQSFDREIKRAAVQADSGVEGKETELIGVLYPAIPAGHF